MIMTEDFHEISTEDNEHTFEHPEPVNIHINFPNHSPVASPALMFGEQSLDAYRTQILNPRQLKDHPNLPDFSYLYSNLIFDYPNGEMKQILDGNKKIIRVDWHYGNGRGSGINQIDYVVNKLSTNPTSRRAVVTLFEPFGHPMMDDPPCLNHIQFILRNGHLNCHALFRSNDMLSAWGGNAYALAGLQYYVCEMLPRGTKMGWLETTSISAHIYWKRDASELDSFRKRWC